ncbi:MAG: ABC transporter permease [Pseudomonadota bacterium]|nr:ABC transporter permease [Pseudomonadota bacterium]
MAGVARILSRKQSIGLGISSFALPILIWCAVSYLPFLWHPQVMITNAGDVSYFQVDTRTERNTFALEVHNMQQAGLRPPEGEPANPVYLPAPHQVATAFVTAFTTPPVQRDAPWLHQSLAHSVTLVFWAFFLASLIGVPLGILCGSSVIISRLTEPFIEFFRYLPAPAFGALAVAILGIYDAPKVAIIVIGTLFQQILIIANTTRKVDLGLLEASATLGANRWQRLTKVTIPAILPDVYRDQRILLGWAWTYLIVAELVGASSGITWFITQQARYQNFDQVYAAILMIGIIGLVTDLILAKLGQYLFRWNRGHSK